MFFQCICNEFEISCRDWKFLFLGGTEYTKNHLGRLKFCLPSPEATLSSRVRSDHQCHWKTQVWKEQGATPSLRKVTASGGRFWSEWDVCFSFGEDR